MMSAAPDWRIYKGTTLEQIIQLMLTPGKTTVDLALYVLLPVLVLMMALMMALRQCLKALVGGCRLGHPPSPFRLSRNRGQL